MYLSPLKSNKLDIVVLCGGEGSRLKEVLPPGTPKCMADVGGQPFIAVLLRGLMQRGFSSFVFCGGVGASVAHDYLQFFYARDNLCDRPAWFTFSREYGPLGSAGAVKLAEPLLRSDPFFIVNGDTICDLDYQAMLDFHLSQWRWPSIREPLCTVALDKDSVSTGVVLAQRELLGIIPKDKNMSFEEDVVPYVSLGRIAYFDSGAEFCDVGTPENIQKFRAKMTSTP